MPPQAGLAGLAAAVPGGIRDCGVRAVDRLESLLRRWAAFGGELGSNMRKSSYHVSAMAIAAARCFLARLQIHAAPAGYCLWASDVFRQFSCC